MSRITDEELQLSNIELLKALPDLVPKKWKDYREWAIKNPKLAAKDGYIVDNKEFNYASTHDAKGEYPKTYKHKVKKKAKDYTIEQIKFLHGSGIIDASKL